MVDCILLAAGTSQRFGSDKLFCKVGKIPLLERTLNIYTAQNYIKDIVIAVNASNEEKVNNLIHDKFSSHKMRIFLTYGKDNRMESSYSALKFLDEKNVSLNTPLKTVLISDACRCFTSSSLLKKLLDCALKNGVAVPVVRHPETLRVIEGGRYIQNIKNDNLFEIQTPQFYDRKKLIEAFKNTDITAYSDESAIYYSYYKDEKVMTVTGDILNKKITFESDLPLEFLS